MLGSFKVSKFVTGGVNPDFGVYQDTYTILDILLKSMAHRYPARVVSIDFAKVRRS